MRARGRMQRAWMFLVPLILFYLVLEVGFSALCVFGIVAPERSILVYEQSDDTIHFDPIIGYRYTQTPARVARVTDGAVEHVGVIVGNAQGFSDRNDFTVDRQAGESIRLAVLGDSFSALKSLDRRWPETAEDLAEADGTTVRLLNFSVGGGGLANWWSILHRMIVAQGYELDGVVFAVFDDATWGDLHRRLYMLDHAHGGVRLGLAPSWDPATWPESWEEAEPMLARRARVIIDSDEFDRMLEGSLQPKARRTWQPYLLGLALGRPVLSDENPYRRSLEPTSNDFLSPGPLNLTQEIRETCAEHDWPIIVVRVPSRQDAVSQAPPSGVLLDFVDKLGATFIDGAEAFRGATQEEMAQLWYPTDGHWNQQGSDEFARMMWDRIRALYPENSAPTPPQTTS